MVGAVRIAVVDRVAPLRGALVAPEALGADRLVAELDAGVAAHDAVPGVERQRALRLVDADEIDLRFLRGCGSGGENDSGDHGVPEHRRSMRIRRGVGKRK